MATRRGQASPRRGGTWTDSPGVQMNGAESCAVRPCAVVAARPRPSVCYQYTGPSATSRRGDDIEHAAFQGSSSKSWMFRWSEIGVSAGCESGIMRSNYGVVLRGIDAREAERLRTRRLSAYDTVRRSRHERKKWSVASANAKACPTAVQPRFHGIKPYLVVKERRCDMYGGTSAVRTRTIEVALKPAAARKPSQTAQGRAGRWASVSP